MKSEEGGRKGKFIRGKERGKKEKGRVRVCELTRKEKEEQRR